VLASAKAWLRAHPRLVLGVYAAAIAAIAFALTYSVLVVNDGDMYFEMARSMRHGTFEVPNGLDIIDSPELWIGHAIKRGPHLYGKYPPLYAVLAAGPYALFGIRGMYLLNGLSLVGVVLAGHALAVRVLPPSSALLAAWLMPVVVPLVPWALLELPHLVSLACFLWAVVEWDEARRAPEPRRAAWRGLAAGLLAGIAFGVRLQDIIVVLPLFVVGFFHSRHRVQTLGGLAGGFAACVLAVSACNAVRFGSPNPFSYGPPDAGFGKPIVEETAAFFLRPAILVDFAIVIGVLVGARASRRGTTAWLLVGLGGAVIAVVPPLREVALRMGALTASVLLNASIAGAGWSAPDLTHGWINKALLSSTPFFVLGLVGMVACAARRAPALHTALAWIAIALLLFLSVRDPDPRTQHSVMGFLSLSPRYLLEAMPGLYLLAWSRLRAVRLRSVHLVAGVVAGAALLVFLWQTGRDESSPAKIDLICTDSVAAAALLGCAYVARRTRAGAVVLGLLVAVTNGYASACIVAEDSRCFLESGAVHDRWGRRLVEAMPEPRIAIVGWSHAKDGIYHVRDMKPLVLIVDPSVDDSQSLRVTLDALVAAGFTPYYFGVGLDRVRPHIEDAYRIVSRLEDPMLWRLERL
jgi:hypothetical protein